MDPKSLNLLRSIAQCARYAKFQTKVRARRVKGRAPVKRRKTNLPAIRALILFYERQKRLIDPTRHDREARIATAAKRLAELRQNPIEVLQTLILSISCNGVPMP
jgi:hypothetical protein